MSRGPSLRFEPLGPQHDRAAFSCGVESLDRYFRELAGQYTRRGLAVTWVGVDVGQNRIAGFYTLSTLSIYVRELPHALQKHLPRMPVPAVLIGRLARDVNYAGRGVGELLLLNALERALEAAATLGAFGVAVDAIDDRASDWYESLGFTRFPVDESRLIMKMETIAELFGR